MVSKVLALAIAVMLHGALASGQRIESGTGYWYAGVVTRDHGRTIVSANEPRPLRQATEAIAQEYGWTVDYEDPVYPPGDAIERTDPAFVASHPGEKQHLVGGHQFRSEFPDSTSSGTSITEEKATLEKIVGDFNKSQNPGHFTILDEGGGRFAIVGITAASNESVLDSRISVDIKSSNGSWALTNICEALTASSGTQVRLLQYPLNVLVRTQVVLHAQNEPARDVLRAVLAQAPQKLMWSLLYDVDDKAYYLNLVPVIKIESTPNGKINQWVR